jgi:hypothetical protein
MEEMPKRRRRDQQMVSLPNRLLMLAREAERRAAQMPACEQRDNLLRKAQTAKITRRTRSLAEAADPGMKLTDGQVCRSGARHKRPRPDYPPGGPPCQTRVGKGPSLPTSTGLCVI